MLRDAKQCQVAKVCAEQTIQARARRLLLVLLIKEVARIKPRQPEVEEGQQDLDDLQDSRHGLSW